jgi:general secretion pathway protein K
LQVKREQRGVILVVVLVFALLLASTVATFVRRATIDHMTAENREATARAESLARGGIRLATALLLEDKLQEKNQTGFPGEVLGDSWAQAGLAPIEMEDGSTLQIRIEDVGSKLNLNAVIAFDESGVVNERTSPLLDALLAKVIEEMPVPPAEKQYDREALVANLVDYVDEDEVAANGASENEAFERGEFPFRPTNEPLLTVDELRKVPGFDSRLVNALRPYVTVYPFVGGGGVNPNTAPPYVLALLFYDDGVDLTLANEDTVRELLTVRQEGGNVCGDEVSHDSCTPIREVVENAIFPEPTFATDVFVVTAEVHVGSVRRSIEAVVDRSQGPQPLLLSWRVL